MRHHSLFAAAITAASLSMLIFFLPSSEIAFAQGGDDGNETYPYQVLVKSKKVESFVLPYVSSNADAESPLVYTFDEPKGPSWILNIQNNMSYIESNENAKTIIKIQEASTSEKFIEIAMFGSKSMRYWVAVSTPEAGYARIYDQEIEGWSRERPISISYADNQGLIVTNGKRIVVDRLDLEGFNVGSIAVYGKGEQGSEGNEDGVAPHINSTYAGNISFEILSGSPADSPVYYVPLGVMIGIGGLVIGLLIFKKRKPSD